MNDSNTQIQEFIIDYCKSQKAQEFAVLIKGRWGSGKTWFINNTIAKITNEKIKVLKISLYGMTSFADIENEFYRLLHPTLSSKKMVLASKIAKGLIKTTLKIDLNGDGKDDVSVMSSIPDLEISDHLKQYDEFVLVFDDLERCSIKIQDILGYINHFVEINGHKVILVANEEEILSQSDDGNQKYKRIKEKLIGRTFEIEPEAEDALKTFINDIDHQRIKKMLKDFSELVLDLYIQSEYKNLRHLKQILIEFQRLVSTFAVSAQTNPQLFRALLTNYLVFSFEIKSGNIEVLNINNLRSEMISSGLDKSIENTYTKIRKKYPTFSAYELVLDLARWVEILDKGVFNKKAVKDEINQTQYLFNEETPRWKKLWFAEDMEDVEIKELIDSVNDDLNKKIYSDPTILLHILGIYLSFVDIGILTKQKQTLVDEFKSYISILKEDGHLKGFESKLGGPFAHESSHSLSYIERSSPEFSEAFAFLKSKVEEATIDNYPNIAKDLLRMMQDDVMKFSLRLQLCNHEENLFFQVPILKYIEIKDFLYAFVNLPQRSKWTVESTIEKRYAFDQINIHLVSELEWLLSVGQKLNTEASVSKPMRRHILRKSSMVFGDAANRLNSLP